MTFGRFCTFELRRAAMVRRRSGHTDGCRPRLAAMSSTVERVPHVPTTCLVAGASAILAGHAQATALRVAALAEDRRVVTLTNPAPYFFELLTPATTFRFTQEQRQVQEAERDGFPFGPDPTFENFGLFFRRLRHSRRGYANLRGFHRTGVTLRRIVSAPGSRSFPGHGFDSDGSSRCWVRSSSAELPADLRSLRATPISLPYHHSTSHGIPALWASP